MLRLILLFAVAIATLFVIPIINHRAKSEKWKTRLYRGGLFLAMFTIGLMIHAELSSCQKHRRIESLEKQELVLRDLRITVQCKFPFEKPKKRRVLRSRGHQVFGYFIDSDESFSVTSDGSTFTIGSGDTTQIDPIESDSTYILMYNNNVEITYQFYDSVEVAKVEFIPFDSNQILNKTVKDLERYKYFMFQFDELIRRLPAKPPLNNFAVSYTILVNGKFFREGTIKFDGVAVTTKGYLAIFKLLEDGLFYDAEKRYLKQIEKGP